MTGPLLTDAECAAIVSASIRRDRVFAGPTGHDGSPPDILPSSWIGARSCRPCHRGRAGGDPCLERGSTSTSRPTATRSSAWQPSQPAALDRLPRHRRVRRRPALAHRPGCLPVDHAARPLALQGACSGRSCVVSNVPRGLYRNKLSGEWVAKR